MPRQTLAKFPGKDFEDAPRVRRRVPLAGPVVRKQAGASLNRFGKRVAPRLGLIRIAAARVRQQLKLSALAVVDLVPGPGHLAKVYSARFARNYHRPGGTIADVASNIAAAVVSKRSV